MLGSIKHIFWDLDHTLWDFETNSKETLAELYQEFELDKLAKQQDQNFFVDRYLLHNDRAWSLYRESRISKSRLRKIRFEAALSDIGIDDKSLAKRIGDWYMDVCPQKSALNPGAVAILDKLNGRFQQHILSNGFHETQIMKLESSGIIKYFDHIITSETASSKKPKPRMYEHAMSKTGATLENSLMIGDNLDIDVKGAVDAGWLAIHYSPEKESSHKYRVQQLSEIEQLLSD